MNKILQIYVSSLTFDGLVHTAAVWEAPSLERETVNPVVRENIQRAPKVKSSDK